MKKLRKLRDDERNLLMVLITNEPQAHHLIDSLDKAVVEEMSDGGMGSLFFHHGDNLNRHFSRQLVEKEFIDEDGVPLIVSINLDNHDELYELDIWKVDFSPLKKIPRII